LIFFIYHIKISDKSHNFYKDIKLLKTFDFFCKMNSISKNTGFNQLVQQTG